jgi:hypothetical protein
MGSDPAFAHLCMVTWDNSGVLTEIIVPSREHLRVLKMR